MLRLPLDGLLVVVREMLNGVVLRSRLAHCLQRHGLHKRSVPDEDAVITFRSERPAM